MNQEMTLLTPEAIEHSRNRLFDLGLAPIAAKSPTNIVTAMFAEHRGISVLPADSPRRMFLSHNGRKFSFGAGVTNYNKAMARRCTLQKDVTSALLRSQGVAAPENAVFNPGDTRRAWKWGEKFASLVIKPADGMKGTDVHLNIVDEKSFAHTFSDLAARYGRVLVEEQLPGTEHRAFVLNNRLVAVTRREPAHVVGDGKNSIRKLIKKKNSDLCVIHKELELDETSLHNLAAQGYKPRHKPRPGVRVYLRHTSNLATGGDAVDATDEITEDERAFIEKAARAVPGLRSAGFDVLLPRTPGTTNPYILEMNGSPMLSMHHFPRHGKPRNAVGALLDAMFPATRS